MIAVLTGQVIHRDPARLVLNVGGVGYQIYVPARLAAKVGQSLAIWCSHQIREDSQTLYGFATRPERSLFELLLSVSGVGPKSALAITSSHPVDRILGAIDQADPSLFEATSGIGKKVAAKIIVELRGKLAIGAVAGQDDLLAALEGLGYRRPEILPILSKLPAELMSMEDKIRWTLRELSQKVPHR